MDARKPGNEKLPLPVTTEKPATDMERVPEVSIKPPELPALTENAPKRPRKNVPVAILQSCSSPGCTYTTKNLGNFKAHMRIHEDDRPFACTQANCNKAFRRKQHLKVHMMTHTGSRPFACDQCAKRFTTKGNLMTHKYVHSGERPFSCDFEGCDMTFTTRSNLKVHRKRHSREHPFVCTKTGCWQAFANLDALLQHKATKHVKEGQVPPGPGPPQQQQQPLDMHQLPGIEDPADASQVARPPPMQYKAPPTVEVAVDNLADIVTRSQVEQASAGAGAGAVMGGLVQEQPL